MSRWDKCTEKRTTRRRMVEEEDSPWEKGIEDLGFRRISIYLGIILEDTMR